MQTPREVEPEHIIELAHHVFDYPSVITLKKFMKYYHEDILAYVTPPKINPALGYENTLILLALIEMKKLSNEIEKLVSLNISNDIFMNNYLGYLHNASDFLGHCDFLQQRNSFQRFYITAMIYENLGYHAERNEIELAECLTPEFIQKTIGLENLHEKNSIQSLSTIAQYYLNEALKIGGVSETNAHEAMIVEAEVVGTKPSENPFLCRFRYHLNAICGKQFSSKLDMKFLLEFRESPWLTVQNLKYIMEPLKVAVDKKIFIHFLLTENPVEEVAKANPRPGYKLPYEPVVKKLFPNAQAVIDGSRLVNEPYRKSFVNRLLRSPHIKEMGQRGELQELINKYGEKLNLESNMYALKKFGTFTPAQGMPEENFCVYDPMNFG